MSTVDLTTSVSRDQYCECEGCHWRGFASGTKPIADIEERLTPGSIVPIGECPDCGMLVYLIKREELVDRLVGWARTIGGGVEGVTKTLVSHLSEDEVGELVRKVGA